jgi:DNA-binding PadR family transcriptional regulator
VKLIGCLNGWFHQPKSLYEYRLYKCLVKPMVDNSKLPPEIKDLLESNIRKKILLILYDDKEKSAYSITKDEDIDITISTVIEHLQKLEKAGLIEIKDATKGKLKRYYYKITKKGKNFLQEYYNEIFNEFREYISIDETATLVNTFMVLEAVFIKENTDSYEIARRTGLNDRTVMKILWNLRETGIILELPAEHTPFNKKRYKIKMDEDDLEKIIQHFKKATNELKEAKKILIKNQEKIAERRSKVKPWSIKR